MKDNPCKKILADGKAIIGTWVLITKHPRIMKILAACGFDFVLIEMEHSDFDMETVGVLTMAARDNGLCPIVRPPGLKAHDMTRPLDAGAMGLLLPNVQTAEEAERIVRDVKYTPKGHRPMNLKLPATDYQPLPDPQATADHLNDHTILVAMIETEQGLENCEAIAAVDGIDGLMVGPDDYTQDIGAPGQMDDPRLEEAHLRVLAAAKANGKFAGCSVQNEEAARKWAERGWQWMPYANDVAMLLNHGTAMVKTLRGIAGR